MIPLASTMALHVLWDWCALAQYVCTSTCQCGLLELYGGLYRSIVSPCIRFAVYSFRWQLCAFSADPE